ncbi:putative membrane protein YccC [Luteibacter rhizovicinus]|uniref:Putative membrane protein YccC n=1 Tax=Luteibacter rhizovicinus TaxID=242606 RepID=A0A4R3YVN3_9GAMM|nr:FUSC family protein [Luteibacter rhizovicinus]TCV97175.1 putative membrane protein YccC [Luteibacter rhizovicinus]
MTTGGYSLRASVLDSLIKTKRPDVPMRVALRNTAAVVLPLALGIYFDYPQVGIGIAAGALDTMFSDQPGPYQQRLSRLFLAALAAGVASLAGFLLGAWVLPMSIATALCGFFGGLLVVFGPDIARVGMTSMLLLVITAATPKPLGDALIGGALIFSGGMLLALFSIAAWPLQRYRPERQALADVYRGLAELARQRQDDSDAPGLTDSMTVLQNTLLGRHRARGRAMEAFRVLLELAERIRLELVAMGELDRRRDGMQDMFRADAARVLSATADALEAAEPPERADRALKTLQASERALLGGSAGAGMTAHIRALSGQLAAAVRNTNWAGSRGELRAQEAEVALPETLRSASVLATLRANITPHSVAFRHAVRCAVVLTLAFAVSRYANLPHGYWMPMTAAIVLRPDFAATLNFGLLRVVGTILGLVLTSFLLGITPNVIWAHIAVMGVLCVAFRYLATAHYGVAVAALTGTVVVLLSFEGVDSSAAMSDRVLNTALGSGMALLAYVLWPTWERNRARVALADMLDAYATYVRVLASPESRAKRHDARTAARTARTNALASVDRMRAEPGTPRHLQELAETLYANGNRLARTAMTLEALIDGEAVPPEWELVGPFVTASADVLHEQAAALSESRDPAPPADLRAMQRQLTEQLTRMRDRELADSIVRVTDRLTDNVDTTQHVIARRNAET